MSYQQWIKASKRVQEAYRKRFCFEGEGYYLWKKYPELELVQNAISQYNPNLYNDPKVLQFMNPTLQTELLDIGCGRSLLDGHFKLWNCDYYGVDICIEAFRNQSLRDDCPGSVVRGLIQANACRLPFISSSFDLVCCLGVLEYYTPVSAAEIVQEMSRVCRHGARLYMNIPNISHPLAKEMLLIEEARGCPNYLWRTQDFENIIDVAHLGIVDRLDSFLMIHYLVVCP